MAQSYCPATPQAIAAVGACRAYRLAVARPTEAGPPRVVVVIDTDPLETMALAMAGSSDPIPGSPPVAPNLAPLPAFRQATGGNRSRSTDVNHGRPPMGAAKLRGSIGQGARLSRCGHNRGVVRGSSAPRVGRRLSPKRTGSAADQQATQGDRRAANRSKHAARQEIDRLRAWCAFLQPSTPRGSRLSSTAVLWKTLK